MRGLHLEISRPTTDDFFLPWEGASCGGGMLPWREPVVCLQGWCLALQSLCGWGSPVNTKWHSLQGRNKKPVSIFEKRKSG